MIQELLRLSHVIALPLPLREHDVIEVEGAFHFVIGQDQLCVSNLNLRDGRSDLSVLCFQPPVKGDSDGDRDQGHRRHPAHPDQPRRRRVPPAPPPRPLRQSHSPRLDRLAGQDVPQVLGQRLRRRVPLPRLLRDRLQDDRLQVPRDRRVVLPGRDGRVVQHPVDELRPRPGLERRVEGQQLVQRHAQAVHVAPGVRPPVEPLRAHVPERADDVAGEARAFAALDLRQAEVRHPDRAVGIQEQVRRLDVAV